MKLPPTVPDATQVLREPARAGLYACNESTAGALFQASAAAGCNVYRIDLGLVTDALSLHKVLARALHFPEWYGRNWDALADSLSDMSWNEADGYVLIFQRAEVLQASEPESFATLQDILQETIHFWHTQGLGFWVMFEGNFANCPTLELRT